MIYLPLNICLSHIQGPIRLVCLRLGQIKVDNGKLGHVTDRIYLFVNRNLIQLVKTKKAYRKHIVMKSSILNKMYYLPLREYAVMIVYSLFYNLSDLLGMKIISSLKTIAHLVIKYLQVFLMI